MGVGQVVIAMEDYRVLGSNQSKYVKAKAFTDFRILNVQNIEPLEYRAVNTNTTFMYRHFTSHRHDSHVQW